MGSPVGELFDDFEPVAVAAASIGQVHRASYQGRPVAVKVQYPGIRDTMTGDTRALSAIAGVVSSATAVDGAAIVAELEERLLEECDYAAEARSQEWFRQALGDASIIVPEVVQERSGHQVLTTIWHDGDRFEDVCGGSAERRAEVARTLARLLWTGLLRHHRIHADPHPGNFLFPDGGQIVVLDFGAVKTFEAEQIEQFRALLDVVLGGRRDEVLGVCHEIGLTRGLIAST